MDGTIIVADDDKSIRTVLSQALTRAGCKVRVTGALSTLWRWLEDGEGDVLVTDVMMPDGDALDILPVVRRKRPDMPIIVMSAQNTVITAIRANETGAYEYLPKPFDLKEFLRLVNNALNKKANSSNLKKKAESDKNFQNKQAAALPLVGRSSVMQNVYRIMARLMISDLGVLISGASGTGKELVAKALHDFGQRKNMPFIKINFGMSSDENIEEELFGKVNDNNEFPPIIGKFEQAESGTLFLDEVADISLQTQAKLLHVIQTGEFYKISSKKFVKTNVRIIAATNKDLKHLISEGLFREDLYYRLNVVPIKLPSLNERIEDLKDLVVHFLMLAEKEGLGLKTLDSKAIELLEEQDWSGNVRELKNFIRRLVVLSKNENITARDVTKELEDKPPEIREDISERPDAERFSIVVEQHLKRYFDLHGDNLPPPGLYDRVLKEIELPLIALSLSATKGNQLKAADLLGINRNTLRKKIRELDINVSRRKKMM